MWNTRGHGDGKATEILFSRKTLIQTFFLSLFISHTRTVTPRYQPPTVWRTLSQIEAFEIQGKKAVVVSHILTHAKCTWRASECERLATVA